jgi:gas vesicle protein
MENSLNSVKLIGALLLGTAVGGALGVLFAPEKGSKTRERLLVNGQDITDSMKGKFDDLLDEFRKEANTAKNKAGDYLDHSMAKAEKAKSS